MAGRCFEDDTTQVFVRLRDAAGHVATFDTDRRFLARDIAHRISPPPLPQSPLALLELKRPYRPVELAVYFATPTIMGWASAMAGPAGGTTERPALGFVAFSDDRLVAERMARLIAGAKPRFARPDAAVETVALPGPSGTTGGQRLVTRVADAYFLCETGSAGYVCRHEWGSCGAIRQMIGLASPLVEQWRTLRDKALGVAIHRLTCAPPGGSR